MDNGNCIAVQASTHKGEMIQILYSKIYMQCYNTPCGEKYIQNKETYNEWYYRASNLNIEAVDDKTGKATF